MTTYIGTDIHFSPDDVRHKYHRADSKCHAYGVLKIETGGTYANLYFSDAAAVRAVIAELALLAAEMDPPVPGCDCMIDAPITDSERTCDQANPLSGSWCHRGGDHGVHRDTNGDEWRTGVAEVAASR